MSERRKSIWIFEIEGEEKPRAVKAATEQGARNHLKAKAAEEFEKRITSARKADVFRDWDLGKQGVEVEEAV